MQLLISRYGPVIGVFFVWSYSQIALAERINPDKSLGFHITAQSLTPSQLDDVQSAIYEIEELYNSGNEQPEVEVLSTDEEVPPEPEPNAEPELDEPSDEEIEDVEEVIVTEEPQNTDEQTDIAADSEEVSPPEPQETSEAITPTATLTISSTWVDAGQFVTLSWNSDDLTQCNASGHWHGSKDNAGSVSVGPILDDSSYALSCEGEEGSALAMAAVRIRSAKLSWGHSEQNTDGSPLTDLSSYRVYIGNQPGNYDQSLSLAADISQVTINLAPGRYYFAISSFDSDANESELSKEVSKLIQ